jgi:predicted AlkP superfamily pyrophosphatase or phosphodiesterase
LKDGASAGIATALVVSLPWMLVAGAPLAQLPWIHYPGLLLAGFLGWKLQTRPGMAIFAYIGGFLFCLFPQSKIELGNGELNPLVVLGMDSANWRFIDEMIAENPEDLPALQELMARGAIADLRSETPTASARIWTIIATGVSHEKNGILNFGNNRSELSSGRIWDSVIQGSNDDPAGTAGVVSWLINTPFNDEPGLLFNTPGWVSGSTESKPAAANPGKVLEGMGEDTGNRPSLLHAFTAMRSAMAVANAENAWAHVDDVFSAVLGKFFLGYDMEDLTWRMKLMRDRINADTFFALSMRHGPDFNAVVLYGDDQLGHFFWKYHEALYGNRELFPSVTDRQIELRGEALRTAYRTCDRVLARLMERTDQEKVSIMLCSDHGMQPLEESRDDQQLKLRGSKLLKAVGMSNIFHNSNIDRGLNITVNLPGEEGLEALNHLRSILEEARDLTAKKALFTLSFPANAPGLLRVDFLKQNKETLTLENELQVGDYKGIASELFEVEVRSGRHTKVGFFLLAGPGVRHGVKLDEVSIYDLAPTMAHLMGKKVPEDLPGKVITQAFTAAYQAENPVRFAPGGFPDPPEVRAETLKEKNAADDNLAGLGYVDKQASKKSKKDPAN